MSLIGASDKSRSQTALYFIALLTVSGFVLVILFASTAPTLSDFLSSASVGLLTAAASTIVGGLLGFLFGIPRSLQRGEGDADEASGGEVHGRTTGYRPNTNLEQISDWLTKILVGVGLTQLTSLPERFHSLAIFLSPGLGASGRPEVLALAILTYFPLCGFLFSYLWTRLFLPPALRKTDLEAIGTLNQKVGALEKQPSNDAEARTQVERYLNPRPDTPEPSVQKVTDAIVAASPAMKTTIFYQAWDLRSKTWRDEATKHQMERTIPIFRGLIASDAKSEFHMNHGQLGFALKDQRQPDWEAAEQELTVAMQIRGDWKEKGWLFYEFNRAMCRINIHGGGAADMPQDVREAILDDLRVAAQSDALLKIMQKDPTIAKWVDHNKIRWRDLRK